MASQRVRLLVSAALVAGLSACGSNAKKCAANADCEACGMCVGGNCVNGCLSTQACVQGGCRIACVDSSNCTGDERCAQGVCLPQSFLLPLGQSCLSADQCRSSICVTGVCCNTRCSGACAICGTDGNCVADQSLCAASGATLCTSCTGSVPSFGCTFDPALSATDCPAGNVCATAGQCLEGNGQPCTAPGDCAGGKCTGHVCQGPVCSDGIKNGNETGVDCGGGTCPACGNGSACYVAGDCVSQVCTGQICQGPTCVDGAKNGNETDVDCGGGACPKCADGKICATAGDCANGYCNQAGVCASVQVQNTASAWGKGPSLTLPSFDPGASANLLVVGLSYGTGSGGGSSINSVTFAGAALNLDFASTASLPTSCDRNTRFYALSLTPPAAPGNIVVNWSPTAAGVVVGAVSLAGASPGPITNSTSVICSSPPCNTPLAIPILSAAGHMSMAIVCNCAMDMLNNSPPAIQRWNDSGTQLSINGAGSTIANSSGISPVTHSWNSSGQKGWVGSGIDIVVAP